MNERSFPGVVKNDNYISNKHVSAAHGLSENNSRISDH